jgi:hypothetical protein
MSVEIIIVLVILAAVILLLVTEWMPLEALALLVLGVFRHCVRHLYRHTPSAKTKPGQRDLQNAPGFSITVCTANAFVSDKNTSRFTLGG